MAVQLDRSELRPKLTVIGVGGAGCNAVNNMIATGLDGVDFIVANTDAQALVAASTELRIQLGASLTEGLGAGSRPEIGEAAAEEAVDEIRDHIKGSHMVFIAAGMGGGTGTGAVSVIARVARELGILTVGVVTKPFLFEGARRMRVAEAGIAELRNYVDTLIVIPNQNLFRIASEKTTFSEAFVMADQVLYSGVACIVDLILKEGLINLDFADVRTVMTGMGTAMMGTGEASGERRATTAAEEAISNPLLDDVSLRGAKGLLLSITGGTGLTLYEVDEAASRVRMEVDPEANIIVGATYDPSIGDRIRVSIVASGMSRAGEAERAPPAPTEDWVRGTKAAAAAEAAAVAAASRAEHASRHVPPPLPQAARAPSRNGFIPDRDYRGGAQDLQQRLSEALLHTPPGAQPGPASPSRTTGFGSNEPNRARPGITPWKGPGNVMIEDGPPQLQGAKPPPLPQGYPPQYDQGGFVPQAPSEVRRHLSRRESDTGDYGPGSQHGYRGAEGAYSEIPRHVEPRRRVGIFERLAGRVRGAGDSDTRQHDSRDEYAREILADEFGEGDHDGYDHYPHAADPQEDGRQAPEVPVFFREKRK